MIELKNVFKDNIEEALNLSVKECQKAFVSSKAYSLAQAYVYRETAFPFAVYVGDTIVGFIMMGYYEVKKQYTLWKFLIDKSYENKGFGRDELKKGIQYMIDKFHAEEIYTGVVLGNEQAKHLYISVGFKETGLVEDNIVEMKYIC